MVGPGCVIGGSREVPWEVAQGIPKEGRADLQRYRPRPEDRAIWIEVDLGECWLDDRSPIDKVEVSEANETVTITVRAHRSGAGEDCLTLHPERVALDRPLGGRTLIDGHTGDAVAIEPRV